MEKNFLVICWSCSKSLLCFLPLKAVNRGKGLLPDPTAMQILTGLSNPAALKMLLNPLTQGHKQGEEPWAAFNLCFIAIIRSPAVDLNLCLCAGLLGAAPAIPPLLANPVLTAALLQLLLQNQAKAQQVPLPFPSLLRHVLPCFCFLPVFDSSSPTHRLCSPLCSVPLYH